MIQEIIKDELFLKIPSTEATAEDIGIAEDLVDTLMANSNRCVGLAANMIGVSKRVIVFDNEGDCAVMLNPVIIRKSGAYETEEACLSLVGERPCKRYQTIKVQYQNTKMQTRIKTYTGWTAQIIQHEIDHCNGIII